MGLSQSIVIVNQFSVKGSDGTGSRGSTPGLYVERYIIDDEKNEALWPLDDRTPEMSLGAYDDEFREISSLGRLADVRSRTGRSRDGVAFSQDKVSMSFADAHELAKTIQQGFDAGKTVFKTVITFEDSYLDKMRVAEPGTSTGRRGAHKGHLDQLRLRHAIQVGMDRMSRGFDDFVWIASMHLDKAHAHAHVAGVDLGEGRLRYDGQQRGKLTKRDMTRLRCGINDDLTASYDLMPFYGTATLERMREVNTVRSYVHAAVEYRGVPQIILAALPEDVSLWHVTSKDVRMQRAIGLAVEYVRDVLQDSSSGFGEAMTEVYAYTERFAKDKTPEERANLVMRASRRIEAGCVQAVFDTLRSLPEEQRTVESSLVDMMAAEGLTLASASVEDSMADFAYKLRAFSTRLRHHTKERRRFHDEEEQYLSVRDPAPESRAAYDFFAYERLYQEKLMAKYQHLMGFLPYDGKWSEELLELLSMRADLARMEHAAADARLWYMSPEQAEAYGHERYGLDGASALSGNPRGLDRVILAERLAFDEAESNLAFDAAEDGMRLDWSVEGGRMSLRLEHEPAHDFDSVRSLDLHHIAGDFSGVLSVDYDAARLFIDSAVDRKRALDSAIDYFRGSGQSGVIGELPVRDVQDMYDLAMGMSVSGDSDLRGTVSSGNAVPHVRTIKISESTDEQIRDSLKHEIESNKGLELVIRQLSM